MERRGLKVIDGRANARSRRDDRKVENAALTYDVEKLGRILILRARTARLELMRLEEGGNDAA